MVEDNLDTTENIKKLQDKIVDLSFQLRRTKIELKEHKDEDYNRIRQIVHNLKNPIGVAYSFSEMIAGEQHLSAEKCDKYLNVIKDSSKFSIDTLNALASINRLNASNFKVNMQAVNYVDLVEKCVETYKESDKDCEILIENKLSKKDTLVDLDSFEIEKTLLNLLDNAVRFSNKGSIVAIKIVANKNTIETLIVDNGIGISTENIPLIFNEFFTVSTYAVDSEKCIGLGLSFVKKVLDAHKFEIEVKSELKKGSVFKIIMPIRS